MIELRHLAVVAGNIDPDDDYLRQLKDVHELGLLVDSARERLARACVERGDSYGEIGRALGTTRQAARKRYPR